MGSDAEYRRALSKCTKWFRDLIDDAEQQGWLVDICDGPRWRFMPPRNGDQNKRPVFCYDPKDNHQRCIVLGELKKQGFTIKSEQIHKQAEVTVSKPVAKPEEPKQVESASPVMAGQFDTIAQIKAGLGLITDHLAEIESLVSKLEKENANAKKVRELMKAVLNEG